MKIFLIATCDWFVVNKLNIHFDEDKTKPIPFASKFKAKLLQTQHKIWDIQTKNILNKVLSMFNE